MPMPVTCRWCGDRGDYWAGGFVRDDGGRGWLCSGPDRQRACGERRRDQERYARQQRRIREKQARG